MYRGFAQEDNDHLKGVSPFENDLLKLDVDQRWGRAVAFR